jgi:UDP-N-acetylglucosamine--N-acetylmuramyl-(pentapeptide) pyrophosphoryl-undecaprenol N-acetylglucosamine transferase
MSRFLISCGGTGGHVSPGISLAEGLVARGHEVVLLISMKKVDARLVEKYPNLRFARMPGYGFGWRPDAMVRFAASQAAAFRFCMATLRNHRPDAVIGFGGFTSAPAVLAARVLGIPVALHEANRVPGRAVRLFGRFAQRVYLPIGVHISGVGPGSVRFAGLPVRSEIVRLDPTAARRALGLDPEQKVLVVFGGSQGASALNGWARERAETLAARDIQVVCVTGLGKGEPETLLYRSASGRPVKALFMPFCDRVAELLSAADIVVSRAGAGTLAELIRCVVPAILVPFPHAASDHQRANAAFFEKQGGGIVIEQSAMAGLHLEVLDLIFNDWLLRQFHANLRRMDRSNSLEIMVADLEEIASRRTAAKPKSTEKAAA